MPLSIFRIKGLAAADVTQIIAMAGFYSMFFFVTLYVQDVLHLSPTRAGASYLPVTVGVAVSAGVCSKLFVRTGTRPIMVAGALLAAAGVYWLSRIPVDGSYLANVLPVSWSCRLGSVPYSWACQTAANAGVPPDKADSPQPSSTPPSSSVQHSGSRFPRWPLPARVTSWPATPPYPRPSRRAFISRCWPRASSWSRR